MYPITSKQWHAFKAYRQNEIKKIKDNDTYAEIEQQEKDLKDKVNGRWFGKKTVDYFTQSKLQYLKEQMFNDIPPLNLNECYKWLLETNQIK